MDHHTSCGRQLLVANVTLEVFCFLVLNEDLLVLKLSLAIKAPYFRSLFLLLTHLGQGCLSLSLSLSLARSLTISENGGRASNSAVAK